jgi:hypothetical protein
MYSHRIICYELLNNNNGRENYLKISKVDRASSVAIRRGKGAVVRALYLTQQKYLRRFNCF